jgi:two-component system CheB/CheR fusion protein
MKALYDMQVSLDNSRTTITAAREAAERANVSKTRFLAAASHDMRQPMQAITTLNYMLKNKLRDEEVFPLVEKLEKNTEVMSGILNQLLDISKLDAGAIEAAIEAVTLNEIFQKAEAVFSLQAQEKGIDFRVIASTLSVQSDPAIVGRILQNLLANAFRHTDTGKILLGCRRDGANLRIEVCDTGSGIAERHLTHIFEEFYQADYLARDRREGMGLGLAIVQRLAQLLNYKLEVSSVPGKGSRFSILIPINMVVAPFSQEFSERSGAE